jgi:chromosome segregation ATPase
LRKRVADFEYDPRPESNSVKEQYLLVRAEKAEAEVTRLKAVVVRLQNTVFDPVLRDRAEKAEAEVVRLKEHIADSVCRRNRQLRGLDSKIDKAEAEVVRLEAAMERGDVQLREENDRGNRLVMENSKLKDELTRLTETADVAMRRTLAAEEQMKDLRMLCGEAAESLDEAVRYGGKLTARLREVTDGNLPPPEPRSAPPGCMISGNNMVYSDDGITWTRVEELPAECGRRRVRAGHKVFIELANVGWQEYHP